MKHQRSHFDMNAKVGTGLILISISILFLILVACTEDEPNHPIILLKDVVIEPEKGVVVEGSIENINLSDISEVGFVWSEEEDSLNISANLKFILDISTLTNEVSAVISNVKGSTDYLSRFYIRTESNVYYSNIQSFRSPSITVLKDLPGFPLIDQVTPNQFHFQDTVQIVGSGFGESITDQRVMLSLSQCQIISWSDTLIAAVTPALSNTDPYFRTGEIFFTTARNDAVSEPFKTFSILPPQIDWISKTIVFSGNPFLLHGKGIHPRTVVNIRDFGLNTEWQDGVLRVYAPPSFDSFVDDLVIETGPEKTIIQDFEVVAPEINDATSNDIVRPGQIITLEGNYLNNESLSLVVNGIDAKVISQQERSLQFEVPKSICDTRVKATIRLISLSSTQSIQLFEANTATPEVIGVTYDNTYDGVLQVFLKNFPEAETILKFNNITKRAFPGTDENQPLILNLNSDLITEHGWVDMEFTFCDRILSFDSVFQFPKPILEDPGRVSSFYNITIRGQHLKGLNRELFLDGLPIQLIRNPREDFIQFKMPFVEEGPHQLAVSVNGRMSDEITVHVVNPWKKLASLEGLLADQQTRVQHYPVAYLHNNMLYIGSPIEGSRDFFAYDLLSETWTSKADLPIERGGSDLDETHGYLFRNGNLYRYNFALDIWEELPFLPGYENYTIGTAAVFTDDQRFFVFRYNNQPYHYYDIANNEWEEISNFLIHPRVSSPINAIIGNGFVYLRNYDSFAKFDLGDLSFETVLSLPSYIWFYTTQGYEWNNELYVIKPHSGDLLLIPKDNSATRTIGSPGLSTNPKLILDGDLLYVVYGMEIWTFDLTKQ